MELIRRSFLTEAGESLLLARSAVGVAVKYGDFLDATGLTDAEVLSDPIISVPVPAYSTLKVNDRCQWTAVAPDMMWHPLFWLPARLSERYVFSDEGDFEPVIETDEMWMVRVALMVMSSGLYDIETGGWIDVLSISGIDVDNPEDCERIQRWQDGAPDAALDAIDLSGYFSAEDYDHALEASVMVIDELRPASWAILAADLHSLCAKADEMDREGADPDQVSYTINIITGMTSSLLSEVPEDSSEEVDETLAAFWGAQAQSIELGELSQEEILDGPIARIARKLDRIVGRYADSREVLTQYFSDDEAPEENLMF